MKLYGIQYPYNLRVIMRDKTRTETVIDAVRMRIASGSLGKGERLPPFGVSLNSMASRPRP
ncbi:hypothetical protein [Asaia platycodi]|uniref:hypothetical protein n=1 Tax=Asaia platycodi TaxID=610243 RepID=UPI001A7EABC9|nr:hypothetical protein [Asaia platycodi]